MVPLIEITGISKVYPMGSTEVTALDGVSLAVEQGEFIAFMGASGSGKSTLLGILGMLDRPTEGKYRFMGDDVTGITDDDLSIVRNRVAGFVFQQFHLLPKMSALENAELPLIYAGKRDMRHRAEATLDDVGLGRRMHHYPNEMSGGEQQRVAISRAMVNDPMIILADEPTGNLDSKSEEEIMRILERLSREGKTILMVTHEEDLARRADRIVRMRDGKIISDTGRKKGGRKPEGGQFRSGGISELSASYIDRAEILDYVKQAFRTIVSHKMRSFLSILGILIGVAAVISMMAIGEGAKEAISQKLSSLGSNAIMVIPGAVRQHGVTYQTGSAARFTFQDAEAIERLKEVRRISSSVMGRAQLVYMNRNWNTMLQGTSVDYQYIKAAVPVAGRFFDDKDVKARRKVAVVGMTVVRELFKNENPVGKTVKINKQNFSVIGVLPSKGASFMRDQDDLVIVPVTTAMYRLLGKDYVDLFDVEIRSVTQIPSAIEDIKILLNKRHAISASDQDAFQIRDMSEIRDTLMSTTSTISLLLGIVASISLFVGGIGIMNIMLVSVRERIKEIGLRKAIGAKRRDILIQFLIEAVLMSLMGGVTGIMVGSAVSYSLAAVTSWSVRISMPSILISTLFSSLVGLFFGLWPAIQASRFDPIVALRYE